MPRNLIQRLGFVPERDIVFIRPIDIHMDGSGLPLYLNGLRKIRHLALCINHKSSFPDLWMRDLALYFGCLKTLTFMLGGKDQSWSGDGEIILRDPEEWLLDGRPREVWFNQWWIDFNQLGSYMSGELFDERIRRRALYRGSWRDVDGWKGINVRVVAWIKVWRQILEELQGKSRGTTAQDLHNSNLESSWSNVAIRGVRCDPSGILCRTWRAVTGTLCPIIIATSTMDANMRLAIKEDNDLTTHLKEGDATYLIGEYNTKQTPTQLRPTNIHDLNLNAYEKCNPPSLRYDTWCQRSRNDGCHATSDFLLLERTWVAVSATAGMRYHRYDSSIYESGKMQDYFSDVVLNMANTTPLFVQVPEFKSHSRIIMQFIEFFSSRSALLLHFSFLKL